MLSRMSLNAFNKVSPKSQPLIQNCNTNRSYHIICRNRNISLTNVLNSKIALGRNFIRHASTETIDAFQIPAPPAVPTIINEPEVLTETLSELSAAGLGTSWTPVSLVQHTLELLHTSVGLPWWAAIITVTVIARFSCFPLIIRAQRHMSTMSEYMPEFQKTQKKLQMARLSRDSLLVEQYSHELVAIMRGREFDALKGLYPSLVQGGVAISIFLALDRMTKAPLQSMQEGGLAWFTNLCVSDPYLILPLMSSTTLLLLMYSTSKMMPMPESTKKVLIFLLPAVAFYCLKSLPAGTLVYWVATNSVTLGQHQLLKLPKVKKYFGLGDLPKPIEKSSTDSPSFMETFRQNIDNMKVSQQVHERFSLKELERRRQEVIDDSKKAESSETTKKDSSV